MKRLALDGDRAAREAQEEKRRGKLAALRHHSGMLTGAYGADHAERLREEWPE